MGGDIATAFLLWAMLGAFYHFICWEYLLTSIRFLGVKDKGRLARKGEKRFLPNRLLNGVALNRTNPNAAGGTGWRNRGASNVCQLVRYDTVIDYVTGHAGT